MTRRARSVNLSNMLKTSAVPTCCLSECAGSTLRIPLLYPKVHHHNSSARENETAGPPHAQDVKDRHCKGHAPRTEQDSMSEKAPNREPKRTRPRMTYISAGKATFMAVSKTTAQNERLPAATIEATSRASSLRSNDSTMHSPFSWARRARLVASARLRRLGMQTDEGRMRHPHPIRKRVPAQRGRHPRPSPLAGVRPRERKARQARYAVSAEVSSASS